MKFSGFRFGETCKFGAKSAVTRKILIRIKKGMIIKMKDMIIAGLQKLSLLDFPGKVACTVFTAGCNLRCPFCHNAPLVVSPSLDGAVTCDSFFEFLKKRSDMLEGVAITGGEPTLMKGLPDFIREIKKMGYAVKLDTNGTNPQMLKDLVLSKAVDYVAMDIKNSPEKYALTAGTEKDIMDSVNESVSFLMENHVDFEFRTTVVKPFHTEDDFSSIGKWIAGDEKYFLQKFVDSGNLIGDGMESYEDEELKGFLNILKQYVPKAQIRGA